MLPGLLEEIRQYAFDEINLHATGISVMTFSDDKDKICFERLLEEKMMLIGKFQCPLWQSLEQIWKLISHEVDIFKLI